ncbi:MAG: PqqD family protein [Acidobacteria bacterium]|jgi:hypothetical protein|nr:PqqD family protein [Acidobacteriota bacterium]
MAIDFNKRVRPASHVLISNLEGESVLLNLQSEAYFGLDKVGSHMWSVLSTSDSIQAAYEILQDTYEIDGKELRQDLADLIAKLMEQELVEVSDK